MLRKEVIVKDIDKKYEHPLAEKFELIFTMTQDTPILLSRHSYALRLLQRIRDEAHRFAVTYHQRLRDKIRL